ncbi:GNAT family N-acetyltransferase [Klebsiella pneumoniae]|uniref:GNAT family N-acetyltransferase n=1 Tax=Klebsiella pneumoniae TaxID=573 RepID=UPI0021D59E3B|nr:GNAT family N-acetyltransferase [Klebsiella pneumoniae]MEB2913787.1 GNAT family N-acetyltransferase [Klebsiella pneumoniae]
MLVQTNRLYLRPVISSDLNDLFKIYGDPATNTFNPAGPYPNIDHAKMVMNRWLDHWQTHSFGIVLSPENHVLPFRFCHKDDALEGKTYWATLQYLLAACSSGK